MPFLWLQDLLEAVKPVLEEEQLQDAADSLFMESDSYDAKIMYHAMKVWKVTFVLQCSLILSGTLESWHNFINLQKGSLFVKGNCYSEFSYDHNFWSHYLEKFIE